MGDRRRSDFPVSIAEAAKKMRSQMNGFDIFLRSIFLPNPVIEELLSHFARFVLTTGAFDGDINTLQYAKAKSWIALSCIHADLACHCVAA